MTSNNHELKTYLTPEDVAKLIKAATNLRDLIIIRMLFYTGCRVSELVGIKITDIYLDQGYIIINHLKRLERRECPSCGKRVGRKTLYCPYCGDKMEAAKSDEVHRRRFLPLGKTTAGMIKEYLDKRSIESERLFPLSRQSVDNIIKEAAYRSGLGGEILFNPEAKGNKLHQVSAHKLRDAFAMHYIHINNTPEGQKSLQQHLGHVNFETTARYLKMDPNQAKEIYDDVFPDA